MDYIEHAVPEMLRRHLQCVWILHDTAPGADVQAVYPDGRCELIAHFAAPMRLHYLDGRSQVQAATLFAGQQRGPIRLQAQGAVHCLGVRLTPVASALVAGSQLAALRDEIVDLGSIEPLFATRFAAAARAFALQRDGDGLWSCSPADAGCMHRTRQSSLRLRCWMKAGATAVSHPWRTQAL